MRFQRALVLVLGCTLPGLFFTGCEDGDPGTSSGTLEGEVANASTGEPIAGAIVTTTPDEGTAVTGADGSYRLSLPVGNYELEVDADDFVPAQGNVSIVAARTMTVDATLAPVAPVVIDTEVTGSAVPGATLSASAEFRILDGSNLISTAWSQSNSVAVTIADPAGATTDVDLPDELAYRDELIAVLSEPPITEEQLPPNLELPEGDFPARIPNRFDVVGASPFAIEVAGEVTLTYTVVTDSGTYTGEAHIETALPFKRSPGLRAVPVGIPVVLHGRDHVDLDEDGINDDTGRPTTYDWSLAPPAGSAAMLTDPNGQNPYFTPDLVGLYTVTVTDTTRAPGTDVVTIEIEAGEWLGAITGQDAEGRPLAAGCTNCHDDVTAPDKFTPWAQTGHAEIFTDNLNTNSHYGPNCLPCHTLGFDPGVDNSGFDDEPDYQAFLDSGLLTSTGDDWTQVIADFPGLAQLAQVQCEHCHGPQFGGSHPDIGELRRTSLSADVCGQCHGEPLRHARFQQWQLSSHANYDLALDEGGSGNCARCHTADGFLAWLPILLDDDPATDPTASIAVTWDPEQVHPQTCATCHDPHAIGTTSGAGTDATVRISGNTPPLIAGFTVIGAGKGAICMTCHNSRRGKRNDSNFADTVAAGDEVRAPHGSAQADVLMGENAYFVTVGVRGNHSLVIDTCVNCHMQQTPPPDLLAYNQGGTNHTFAPSTEICSNCHGASFDAEGVQSTFNALSDELKMLVEAAILDEIATQTAAGRSIQFGSSGVTVSDASTIATVELGESRGRQAITVTLTDATSTGAIRMNEVRVLDSDAAMTDLGDLYDFTDDRIPRAGWNWALAHNDGSDGVHNPDFVSRFLSASVAAMNDVLAP